MEQLRDLREMYSVLSRLIRRPMRRWWLSVGIWFLLIIVLLIAYKMFIEYFRVAYWTPTAGLYQSPAFSNNLAWSGATAIECILMLTVTVWFLAACASQAQVKRALENLTVSSSQRTRQVTFLVILTQGILPASLVFIMSAPTETFWSLRYHQAALPAGEHWNLMIDWLGSGIYAVSVEILLPMIWIALMLCLTYPRYWPALSWMFLTLIFPLAISILSWAKYTFGMPALQSVVSAAQLENLDWVSSWLVGGLVVVAMLWAFGSGRLRLAHSLLAVVLAASFLAGWGEREAPLPVADKNDPYNAVGQSEDWAIAVNYLRSLGGFTHQPLLTGEDGNELQIFSTVASQIPVSWHLKDVQVSTLAVGIINILWFLSLAFVITLCIPWLSSATPRAVMRV